MQPLSQANYLDRWQNFYHLSSIQIVSLGIPAIIIGTQLSAQYGPGTAICSIFVGNLILWLIGLAITAMVYQQHTNAIENIRGYIGTVGGLLFAIILLIVFLDWYVMQIKATTDSVTSLFRVGTSWGSLPIIQLGATLGVLTALLAIGGIRLLRWITTISFPLIVLYNIVAIWSSPYSIASKFEWGLSLPGVILAIFVLLPGFINLPTFFRHSRSKADSFLALTLMLVFYTFFECASIWMDFSVHEQLIASSVPFGLVTFILPTACFLIVTSVCSNLLNIYLASACYETFIPQFISTKSHAIIGLVGTIAYTFIQIASPVRFLAKYLNCYIGVIGIVLLVGVLSRLIIRHRPRQFEKTINMLAWVVGCVVATAVLMIEPEQMGRSLLLGMGASGLFFLITFCVEETCWSIKSIMKKADS